MRIALGCDKRGFRKKLRLMGILREAGHEVLDVGCSVEEAENPSAITHYPIYAFAVGQAVAEGRADRGILVCMSGNGMTMAANRIQGIRAALCLNPQMAELARSHNDANVMCLTDAFSTDEDDGKALWAFLDTPFEGGRHQTRVDMLESGPSPA